MVIRSFVTALCLFVGGLLCLDPPAKAWWQSVQQVSVGSAPVTTALDGANKSPFITLSGGNLVATVGVGSGEGTNVRSVAGHSSGKYHFEATLTNQAVAGSCGIGIVASTFVMGSAGTYMGEVSGSVGYYSDGSIFNPNTTPPMGTSYTTGDTAVVEIDIGGATISFAKNTGSYTTVTPDGALQGGVTLYAAIECETNLEVWTVNFGASGYVKTPTATYGNW